MEEIVSKENIKDDLRKAKLIIDWIFRQIDGLEELKLSKEEKFIFMIAAYDFTIHCARSICILIEHEQYGAALALMRPLMDSFMRGNWIQNIATTVDFIRAKEKDRFPNNPELFQNLQHAFNNPKLKNIVYYFNDYVHVGFRQLESRILDNNSIGNAYTRREIINALFAAYSFGLLAMYIIALQYNKKCMNEAALKKIMEFELIEISK
ncbi:MAG: hypothetical protein OXC02_09385 [Rhodobacteraceae bacterium]|nr:hypothetical protein [Paracoccaceae bacterium]